MFARHTASALAFCAVLAPSLATALICESPTPGQEIARALERGDQIAVMIGSMAPIQPLPAPGGWSEADPATLSKMRR